MPKKKAPQLGKIFSSSSSDEDLLRYRKVKTSASEKESDQPIVRLRVNLTSVEDKPRHRHVGREPLVINPIPTPETVPDGYILYEKTKLHLTPQNTIIGYQKHNDNIIVNKYFKGFDQIGNRITVGFYKHDKRNYSESLDNIKYVFTKSITGGDDPLKDTIEVPKTEWRTLKRDMVISYQKHMTEEWVYRAKYNSIIKSKDGSDRLSLTSERGYGYIANPNNIAVIRRHITHSDKMTTYILEHLNKLEKRVLALEKNKSTK